jgi:N-acylneuraminate cytidylyltransferase
MEKVNILGIIPARGGSKGIKNKNIKLLCGKPLIYYTIAEAKKAKFIKRIIVSTDSPKIRDIARKYGAEVPFLRPKELAKDFVTDLPVFKHCLKWLKENEGYRPDIVVQLRPTAPLRKAEHIDKAIELLLNSKGADSVRSVTKAGQHPFKMWRMKNNRLLPFISQNISRREESYNLPRQKLPLVYIQNGSLDVIWPKTILEKGSMSGDVILPFVMKELDSVNIDEKIDFLVAETIIKKLEFLTK